LILLHAEPIIFRPAPGDRAASSAKTWLSIARKSEEGSAVAVLRYGFNDLSLKNIMAFALPQNRASLRALEKLGFRYLYDFVYAELLNRRYEMSRDQFAA
jgi:GNAT acetyltransferase-like protein